LRSRHKFANGPRSLLIEAIDVPYSTSAHRAPGKKTAVPIYQVLEDPAESRTFDLPAPKRTHLPLDRWSLLLNE